jgi:hypothetical protein
VAQVRAELLKELEDRKLDCRVSLLLAKQMNVQMFLCALNSSNINSCLPSTLLRMASNSSQLCSALKACCWDAKGEYSALGLCLDICYLSDILAHVCLNVKS